MKTNSSFFQFPDTLSRFFSFFVTIYLLVTRNTYIHMIKQNLIFEKQPKTRQKLKQQKSQKKDSFPFLSSPFFLTFSQHIFFEKFLFLLLHLLSLAFLSKILEAKRKFLLLFFFAFFLPEEAKSFSNYKKRIGEEEDKNYLILNSIKSMMIYAIFYINYK